MATAVNIGRINVWPTYDDAREAAIEVDTPECEFVGRLTVWETNAQAQSHLTSEGGSGGLDWVPDNAVIHIDFINDRAWTEADGEVAIDTLMGSDVNTEGYWAVTGYNPASLTVNGYVHVGDESGAVGPAFIGDARTFLIAGTTMTVQYYGGTVEGFPLGLMDGAGSVGITVTSNPVAPGLFVNVVADGSGLFLGIDDIVNEGGINRVAITYVPETRFDLAVNGSTAETGALSNLDSPIDTALVALSDHAIQSITIYDALPSTTGLSELSEVA